MANSIIQVTSGGGPKISTWNRTIGANSVEEQFLLPGEYPYASYVVVAGGVSAATANAHLIQLMAGSSLNVRIRRIEIYQAGLSSAVNTVAIDTFRLSSAGTGGGVVTPAPLDTTDSASGATAQTLPSSKGTETTVLDRFRLGVVAAQPTNLYTFQPLYAQGANTKPLMIPAGTANGIALKIVGNCAGLTLDVSIEFVETAF